jgi:hypothetical protein
VSTLFLVAKKKAQSSLLEAAARERDRDRDRDRQRASEAAAALLY